MPKKKEEGILRFLTCCAPDRMKTFILETKAENLDKPFDYYALPIIRLVPRIVTNFWLTGFIINKEHLQKIIEGGHKIKVIIISESTLETEGITFRNDLDYK